MNVDMVWAEIAVAAVAGSVFYGVVALIERSGHVLASVHPQWGEPRALPGKVCNGFPVRKCVGPTGWSISVFQ